MKDAIGDRMKNNYEDINRTKLYRRTPVIIRVDGRAFHTFTRGLDRPFDRNFIECMNYTAKTLAEEAQGCKLAYVQSDEISLLLTDYDNLDSEAWFDYNVQKVCSIAASIATLAFFKKTQELLTGHIQGKSPVFDARCFNIPKEEVCNYFIWRQKDAMRNSLSSVAQFYFSHNQLKGLNQTTVKNKLNNEVEVDWDSLTPVLQRGRFCIKVVKETASSEPLKDAYEQYKTNRKLLKLPVESRWIIDPNTPNVTREREFIDRHVFIGEQ